MPEFWIQVCTGKKQSKLFPTNNYNKKKYHPREMAHTALRQILTYVATSRFDDCRLRQLFIQKAVWKCVC
jgi:hypothetical protein